jgi:hypothetical protein
VTYAGEVIERQQRGQVDQRPWHRRDGDAANPDHVPLIEMAATLRPETVDPTPLRHRHLGRRRTPFCEPEQVGRRTAADCRTLSTGLHRRHALGVHARSAVSDPVDAVIPADQQPVPHPPLDLAWRYVCLRHLLARDDAVSPTGDPGEFLLHWPAFWSHTDP